MLLCAQFKPSAVDRPLPQFYDQAGILQGCDGPETATETNFREFCVKTLIAIPVYNERQHVTRVLARVRRFHPELLVIDDASTDGTATVLSKLGQCGYIQLVRHPSNEGYGQSLIDAFEFADKHGYDWIITMDCDEQHEPKMIPEFLRQIEMDDADIISGSRYLAPRVDDDAPPGDRRRINQIITRLINDRLGLGLTDAFCGFKAARVSAMRKLNLTVSGYAFPMQFWPQAAAAGLRIREIPVRLIYNDPNRHFGGQLDDPENRLNHYLSVFEDEMARLTSESPVVAEPCATSCCCEG
jgi:glycosyltransferase involved in cell wall biosynthesis